MCSAPSGWNCIVFCSSRCNTGWHEQRTEVLMFLPSYGQRIFSEKYWKCQADWFSYNSWLLSIQKMYCFLLIFSAQSTNVTFKVSQRRRLLVEEFSPRSSGSVTHNKGTPSLGECCQSISLISQFTFSISPQLQRKAPPALQTAKSCWYPAHISLHSNARTMTPWLQVVS